MTQSQVQGRYHNRVLTIIAAIMLIAALRNAFAVIMPIAFAAIIVAALWPLSACSAGICPRGLPTC